MALYQPNGLIALACLHNCCALGLAQSCIAFCDFCVIQLVCPCCCVCVGLSQALVLMCIVTQRILPLCVHDLLTWTAGQILFSYLPEWGRACLNNNM